MGAWRCVVGGDGIAGVAGLPIAHPVVCVVVGQGAEYSQRVTAYRIAAFARRMDSRLVVGGCAPISVGRGVPSGGYEDGNRRQSRADGGNSWKTFILPPPPNKCTAGVAI